MKNEGAHSDSYAQVLDLLQMYNPETITGIDYREKVNVDDPLASKRDFVCLNAMRVSFQQGC